MLSSAANVPAQVVPREHCKEVVELDATHLVPVEHLDKRVDALGTQARVQLPDPRTQLRAGERPRVVRVEGQKEPMQACAVTSSTADEEPRMEATLALAGRLGTTTDW